jgi:hypothetical protein
MSMILPYHDIATAAALSQVSVCAARPATQTPGQDRPLFACASGFSATPIHKPSRLARLVGAVLAPISGPTLSHPRSGASNI